MMKKIDSFKRDITHQTNLFMRDLKAIHPERPFAKEDLRAADHFKITDDFRISGGLNCYKCRFFLGVYQETNHLKGFIFNAKFYLS